MAESYSLHQRCDHPGDTMQLSPIALLSLALLVPNILSAAEACRHRGDLDRAYCDENRDFVADAPKDRTKYKNPDTLMFMYIPVQDAATNEKIFTPLTEHLARCTNKKVVYARINSEAEEIEA